VEVLAGGLRVQVAGISEGLESVVSCAQRSAAVITHIASHEATLEDAFVKLTGVEAEIMKISKPQKQGGG
jgi:hypothetical protein